MKEKFTNTLGLFGTILYFLYSILVSIMPFIMIGASFWLTFLFLCIEQMFPLSTFVFWIWGLVRAIGGVQDVWAIIYYVLFVVLFIPFILGCILDSLPRIPSRTSSHAKQRYCKLCGGTIDPATKKCDKCGKQYFRWKYFGRISAISLIVLTIIALITVIVYQNVEYQKTISELNDTIASLTSTVESQEAELSKRSSTILSKLKEIREMDQKLSSLQTEIRFYDKHVVFVPDDGNRTYHMYECYYFRTSDESFWAYNTEQAIYRGFSPCKYCCSE